MDTRRTSGLVVLGFLFSLAVYGTFVASVIMAAIVTLADQDHATCWAAGFSARDLGELLGAIRITSIVGLALSALPVLLSLGGTFVVFGDRLRKRGLSLAAVALGLTAVAAAGHGYLLSKHPQTRMAQAAPPFEMVLDRDEESNGTEHAFRFDLSLSAKGGSLDVAKGYTFSLIEADSREGREIEDVTDRVMEGIGSGRESARVALGWIRFTPGRSCNVAIQARLKGAKRSLLRDPVSDPVYVYMPYQSRDR